MGAELARPKAQSNVLIYPNRGKIAKARQVTDLHFHDTRLAAMPTAAQGCCFLRQPGPN